MPERVGPAFIAGALVLLCLMMVAGAILFQQRDSKASGVLVPEATIPEATVAAKIGELVATPAPAIIVPLHCTVVQTRSYSNASGLEATPNTGTETTTTEVHCNP